MKKRAFVLASALLGAGVFARAVASVEKKTPLAGPFVEFLAELPGDVRDRLAPMPLSALTISVGGDKNVSADFTADGKATVVFPAGITRKAVCAGNGLRLRSAPGLSSEVRGSLQKGEAVTAVACTTTTWTVDGVEKPWYLVLTAAGKSGWAFGGFLEVENVILCPEIDGYLKNFADFKSGKFSLEELFKNARSMAAVCQSRMRARYPDPENYPWGQMPSLMHEEASDLFRRLGGGFSVNVGFCGDYCVEPTVLAYKHYFQQLAREMGKPVDVAYYELMDEAVRFRQTVGFRTVLEEQPEGMFVECRVYGDGVLTRLYGRAIGFQKEFPGAYADRVQLLVDVVGRVLQNKATHTDTLGRRLDPSVYEDCVCGGSETVIQELELFLAAYPSSPIAPGVRENLEAVKNGSSKIELNCHPN